MTDHTFDPHLLVGFVRGHRYERENVTETEVSVPPAFLITDSDGAAWTLGTRYVHHGGADYEFNVLRNDVDTGESAQRIVYRRGVVWIFGRHDGGRPSWKQFSRSRRHFI